MFLYFPPHQYVSVQFYNFFISPILFHRFVVKQEFIFPLQILVLRKTILLLRYVNNYCKPIMELLNIQFRCLSYVFPNVSKFSSWTSKINNAIFFAYNGFSYVSPTAQRFCVQIWFCKNWSCLASSWRA